MLTSLLSALAQALQGLGLDLSQANMSVQIDLGKHASRGLSAKVRLKQRKILVSFFGLVLLSGLSIIVSCSLLKLLQLSGRN